jgi:hypothetical protein
MTDDSSLLRHQLHSLLKSATISRNQLRQQLIFSGAADPARFIEAAQCVETARAALADAIEVMSR